MTFPEAEACMQTPWSRWTASQWRQHSNQSGIAGQRQEGSAAFGKTAPFLFWVASCISHFSIILASFLAMLLMFLWNEAELKKVLKDRSFPSKVADIWNRSPSSAMSAEMVSGELRGRLGDWTEVDDGSFNVGPFLFQTNCWFWTVLSVIRRASNFDIVVFSIK